jgi:hypothetical protein
MTERPEGLDYDEVDNVWFFRAVMAVGFHRVLGWVGLPPKTSWIAAKSKEGMKTCNSITVLPWMVPGGGMSFSPTRFLRSLAEVRD